MENFNVLFEEAAKVADRRRKVFNELIDQTVSKTLPNFCEACKNLDLKTVYFKLETKPNSICETKQLDYLDIYIIAINVADNTISDANYNYRCDADSLFYTEIGNWFKPEEITWKRSGIVEFVIALNSRLSDYIKKYSEKNNKAESMLSHTDET